MEHRGIGVQHNVTALILAGGQSRRMGGVDKGLIQLSGMTLVERVITRIAPQVQNIIISANRHAVEYQRVGYPVISDEGHGPLSGLLAGLRHTQQAMVLTLPCDTPFIPHDLLPRLLAGLLALDAEVAIPVVDGHTHQAVMLCRADVSVKLGEFLHAGGRSVQDWLQGVRCSSVSFEQPGAFFNINTPADLMQADHLVKQSAILL